MEQFKIVSWDAAILGIDAYELTAVSLDTLEMASHRPGHYTVRVDPLMSKKLLHDYGFYYCDTLIQPYCEKKSFVPFDALDVSIGNNVALESLLKICHGAFSHGRFHRDFNISPIQANLRYDNWLGQLYFAGKVRSLLYRDELAGFIAVEDNMMILHALTESKRGIGLAKYLWTPVCRAIFEAGNAEVVSSISVSNLAALNLYARLGFRFRNPVDIYHKKTQ